ncbi:gamma-glutamyltransferase family protein [Ramlibacter sp.]|uniref:gamma-glutamyltransferase family protein n=1 Tax=Ramlibacter sp. TaxID=1917967 RepID=UPI003D0F4ECC
MPANGRTKSLYGRRRAVVTGHHLATRAAEDVLDDGGTLVDAMVCASAVLTVALPHTSSLGGCAMAMIHDPAHGGLHALNGTGRAPLAATAEHFAAGMPQRGASAAVTPTLVRFWARAHERLGSLPWQRLLSPAIELAEEGVPLPEELARNLGNADAAMRSQPGFADTFAIDGRWLRRGELLRQPRIAAVLREIAARGEAGFYEGWVASGLVQGVQSRGGLIAQEDLARAQADWVQPLRGTFQAHDIFVMPPNSMGVLMLQQLQDASGGDLAREVASAIDIIARGQRRIGDPSRVSEADFTTTNAPAIRAEPGDTTGFVAMDHQGRAIAMLQSVFQPFGSGYVDARTGVLLNNRMFDFSLAPGHVNQVAPGMRPAHTLNPYIAMRDGAARLAGVSPGGVSQTTTGAQVLRGALGEPAASLGEVVSRDRWSLGRDGAVLLEKGVPSEVAARLREAGLRVTENSEHEFYFGSAKVIRRLADGTLEAAADPRRQAHAAAG